MAFMSRRPLTGYDNEDLSSQAKGERLDEEVYLYDAHTASLTCVSCDPTGARPTGVLDKTESGEGFGLLADRRGACWERPGAFPAGPRRASPERSRNRATSPTKGGCSSTAPAHSCRESPRRHAARTSAHGKVVPVGVENVYEYEPPDTGGCTSASACVALISSGTSQAESVFLEATPSWGRRRVLPHLRAPATTGHRRRAPAMMTRGYAPRRRRVSPRRRSPLPNANPQKHAIRLHPSRRLSRLRQPRRCSEPATSPPSSNTKPQAPMGRSKQSRWSLSPSAGHCSSRTR